MKYIQSFYQYPVTFSSVNKTIPARNADGELRNIAEFTESEVETLEKSEPFFRKLLSQKKIRVLNKLPDSYRSSTTLVNEARQEAEEAKAENAELKARIAELEKKAEADTQELEDMSRDELKEKALSLNIKVSSKITKTELIEAIKAVNKEGE